MRRTVAAAAALAATLALAGTAAAHDHPAPSASLATPPTPGTPLQDPPLAWTLIASVPTGNPHTDIDFFTLRDPDTNFPDIYMSAGTLAAGPNGAGQTIVKLTEQGHVSPNNVQYVTGAPSAECPSNPSAALGLQHDVEATPKGNVIFNTKFPTGVNPDRRDAQLILDASDQRGRCHDNGDIPVVSAAPRGGLELIDITNIPGNEAMCPVWQADLMPENNCAVEIHLTAHIGEAHTVNVDPKRPHIAFAVTSDSLGASCNADDTVCTRPDEDANPNTNQGNALDGFELVDLKSCLDFAPGTPLSVKREQCRPKVYRYRWPSALIGLGHSNDTLGACHELEFYPDDTLVCAGLQATMYFSLKGAFNDMGTPNNFLDDTVNGTPLPCRVRPSSSGPVYFTGAMVTDCADTNPNQAGNELSIEGWNAIGSPSLAGVVHLGTIFHQGGSSPNGSDEDIQISHEAEKSDSWRLIITSDERGGGVSPPGATCGAVPGTPGPATGNGGLHAYRIDKLLSVTPPGVDQSAAVAQAAWVSYARTPSGDKAIYRAPIIIPNATLCTAHVFQQIPGQNRIFMGWYTQGTQVVDFIERRNGTVEWVKVGHFVPPDANEWVSHVFKMKKNANGTFTYWGATGDFTLGPGRSTIDIWQVTLPAPPKPRARP